MDEIFHILYASSAAKPFGDPELAELLSLSQRNNASLGITGMLLYAEGNFIQYIEGPEDAVDDLYRRIARDPRHRSVFMLSEGSGPTRLFPDWTMGYRAVAKTKESPLGRFDLSRASIDERLAADVSGVVLTMMRQFYSSVFPHSTR